MLTGMRRKRRMLKPCKNAAKNCLTTLYLYKQTAKAAPRGPGPGEEPSGGYSGVLELQISTLSPSKLALYTVTSPTLQTWPQHLSVWSASDGKFSTDGPDTQSHSAHCHRTLPIWALCCEWCKKEMGGRSYRTGEILQLVFSAWKQKETGHIFPEIIPLEPFAHKCNDVVFKMNCSASEMTDRFMTEKACHHVKPEASHLTNLWVMSWCLHPIYSLCRLHNGWKPLSFPASPATLGNVLQCHKQ